MIFETKETDKTAAIIIFIGLVMASTAGKELRLHDRAYLIYLNMALLMEICCCSYHSSVSFQLEINTVINTIILRGVLLFNFVCLV
jgi:hypothetical protein